MDPLPAPGEVKGGPAQPCKKNAEAVTSFREGLGQQLQTALEEGQAKAKGAKPLPGFPPRHSIRVFSQDESRLGLMPIRRRRLTLKGVKPVGRVQHAFENYYLYGAVEPLTGESMFWELPSLTTECFQLFVDQFAQCYAQSFNVLLVDNAACHKAKGLKVPTNVVLLPLPPYSPELNPIERVWQDLKGRLAGQVFESLQALKEKVAELLQSYLPQELRSLTGYPYIVEAINGLVV